MLLDTYRTFGCENSEPTFRYSLLDGVKDGYLVNPTVVDARTQITTELLSEEGFVVNFTDDQGEDQQAAFKQREFEKRFFSDATNQLFCKTLLTDDCGRNNHRNGCVLVLLPLLSGQPGKGQPRSFAIRSARRSNQAVPESE